MFVECLDDENVEVREAAAVHVSVASFKQQSTTRTKFRIYRNLSGVFRSGVRKDVVIIHKVINFH